MDLGNIVYIVAVIGYFIYQATRKRKHQEPDHGPIETNEPQRKPLSFEDLMKEIREAQKPASTPMPQPVITEVPKPLARKPVRTYAEPEDDEEIRYYEDTFERKNKNPYQAASDRHSVVPNHEIKMNYDSLKSKSVNPYAALLKNPKTLREAVIVSEILKPKHF